MFVYQKEGGTLEHRVHRKLVHTDLYLNHPAQTEAVPSTLVRKVQVVSDGTFTKNAVISPGTILDRMVVAH